MNKNGTNCEHLVFFSETGGGPERAARIARRGLTDPGKSDKTGRKNGRIKEFLMIIGEFSEAYPPTIDGVAGVVHNYCKEMTRRGHRCIFIGPNNKKTEPSTDYEVLLYRSVKPSRKLPYRLGAPQMQPGFRALIDEIPFDLVHAHTPFMSGRFAREVARKRGIPLVATFHSKYYDDSLRVTGSPFISRRVVEGIVRFYESCDEVWTVNRRTAMVLRGYGYRGPIVVMQNGIDPAEEREVGDISDLAALKSEMEAAEK